MKRLARRVAANAAWVDGDFYLHVNANPVRIKAGSRQRAIPCVICQTPAGGQECFLLALVAGLLCPVDNSHLGGLGAFCHVSCMPEQDKALIDALVGVLARSGH